MLAATQTGARRDGALGEPDARHDSRRLARRLGARGGHARSSTSCSRSSARAAGTDLASTAAFDIGASLDRRPDHRRRGRAPLSVRQHAPCGAHHRAAAARVSRVQRALLPHGRHRRSGDRSPLDPTIPGYNFDIVAGADYTLDISQARREPRHAARSEGAPGDGRRLLHHGAQQLSADRGRRLRDAERGAGRLRSSGGDPRPPDRRGAPTRHAASRRTLRYATGSWSRRARRTAAYRAMQGPGFDAVGARRGRARRDEHLKTGRWIRIIATNDFHGVFEPRVDSNRVARGGAPQLATAIARARAECTPPGCRSIWLDGGDEFQGTPASNIDLRRERRHACSRGSASRPRR